MKRSFSLPSNLSKTAQPKYQQSGKIKFASDLERAAYSATTSTSSDPGKRKRTKYRKLLQDAGYSTTEINAMGREVRSQMRDQYDGPGSELFVALPQDVVAEAAPAVPLAGSVNLTQKEIQFFDSFLGNKANREELLEEVPSLRISEGRLFIDPSDVNNLNNFVSDVGVSDGLGTVPPRLKTSQFYKPFFTSVGPDVVAEAAPLDKVSSKNQVDVVDSTVTKLVDPVDTDPAEGGKVRSIAKRFALKTGIIDFKKLFKTTGALKVSERVYKSTVKKAAEKISKVLDKSFIQFPKFEAWYSSRLNMAMKIFQELDPDLSKPKDQFIMKTLLAVTSNGNEVSDQTAESFRIYQDWKRTGTLDQKSTQGTREETILEHLRLVDVLIAKVGWKDLEAFMSKVGPVSELRKELQSRFGFTKKQAKDMTNGELVTEVVPYSLFLGPKLGSFFNNLSGNFDTTTMDRWFMRTFGRTMGDQLVKVDIQKPKQRLIEAIDSLIADPGSNLFKTLKGLKVLPKFGKAINANQIKRIATYFALKANRQGLSSVENEVRLAINGMVKVSDGFKLMEAPASGTHRRFIRAVMKKALDDFNKRNNTNFTPAEAQAILWYYEKLIHESNGSRQKGEAPDYAAGANAIYRTINGRDSGQFVRSDVIRRRGDLSGGTQELQQGQQPDSSQVPAGNRLFGQPLQDSTSVSERYQRSRGIRGQEPRPVVELDEERAAVIGKAYDKMKHDPTNPEVVRAYDALVKETIDQYDAILEDGYAMELSEVEYNSSQDMIDDVRNRKVMRVFSTEDGFGTQGISAKERRENPMLAETSRTDKNGKPLLVNDIFRFVHDFFGHGKLGNGFGPIGEENAWNVHSLMFSPLARRALTTETRGQNSWVNFSGVNDKAFEIRDQARKARADGNIKEAKRLSKLAYGKMKFADQKIGLLPSEFSESTYQEEVTAEAAQPEVEDRGPQDTFANGGQVMDFVESTFDAVAKKVGVAIRPAMGVGYTARYNATQQVIEYNPMALLNRSKSGVKAAMREEIIHASMHQVLMQKATKGGKKVDPGKVWVNFFDAFAKTLTAQERVDIGDVYQSLTTYHALGAEYSRAVVQNLLYGEFSEQYVMQSKGGPAWNRIVDLLRSVQAYMAKVLGPMRKTNPEAAQVIVDSVELLKAADPDARPKNQQVVAEAYDAVDNNTAKENTEAGESVDKKASERIREERKWWSESSFRKTASKYLTPIITRLNRINPMFGRILQGLDTAIRERSFGYRKQTEAFFNKLNAVKGAEFQELKQMLFFSPTPEEANLPSNKAKLQRRDALLHKHGLLNMYRLDVQPILEEIYAEYTELGMPRIGYLEDYFPRVVKDLEGLIKSYGHKTKRTFEMLVKEENDRRSKIKESEGGPLPPMEDTERARFFQNFLQNKFRVDINGARLPGNIKVREIQLIPEDKLKYYDDPGVAFGKYTTNMSRAIESFKVVGDTRKGRLQGTLGLLTEKLFSEGQIDQADADELKTLTELITAQFATENEILKSLGTLTYMATLINPGPVLVQIMDLYKVALYRGLSGVVSGTYRTVTGNRRFDIEKDFSIAKTQLSAEFEDPSVLQKALDFGLSRLVPFRQMDTAMKHASIEAAYDDFVKKAKAPVGSKKYEQLLRELTITMGREDALKTISDLKLDKAMDSALVKEALLSELLQRQPLTYLQVPEGYQTDPSKRLFYKLSTFMLLDLNYNRQEFMNDLGGPGKTLKQRTVALRRLAYMATLLTMFGLPSDMLDDWIAGKDTYIPEHVMNNMLGMFGLSKYTTTRALEKGTVESVIQRFTPPAINIMIKGESSLRSWVKGDTELFEMKAWQNAPLSDVWYYRTGAGKESQRKYRKKQRKEGITPTIPRS